MQLVAVSSFLTPATKAVYPQRIWLFCVGPGPFLLLVLRLSVFGRNANLAGGFAGRRLWVFVVFAWLFPLFVDYSRGPFLAAMFLLVFWILFWEP